MRVPCILLFLVSLAIGASAQQKPSTEQCPDVLVQDYAWGVAHRSVSTEDARFKANSSGRPLNPKDNPINTVGNPVNMAGVPINTSPVRPQGSTPVPQVTVGGNPETVQTVDVRRETYVLVKNSGSKIIKSIKWDYVFFTNQSMEQEVKRHKFSSKKKIAPGEVKFLSEPVFRRAPSRYQLVFVNRVEFTDGTIWQRP